MFISFVIACYNEESTIGDVIESICILETISTIEYEILVMDNCSTDSSAEVAKGKGASVFISNASTVGAVRNEGVSKIRGTIIVFIDADVILTPQWVSEIDNVYNELKYNEMLITGSHCGVPESLDGALGCWYREIAKDCRNTHLGTGHMIIHRNLFNTLGGFDIRLKTGEDYDLCERARLIGAQIRHNDKLHVIHLGFPDTFLGFLKREWWHGLGDVQTFFSMVRSKVVLASIFFCCLHLMLIYFTLSGKVWAVMLTIVLIVSFLFITIIYKFKKLKPRKVICLIPIAYLYFVGRSMALLRFRVGSLLTLRKVNQKS